MAFENGLDTDRPSRQMMASEVIASNPEAEKTFRRFKELTDKSTLWLSHESRNFNFVELSGATQSGMLFHLWRVSGDRSEDHITDFLLIVGDIHSEVIEQATLHEVAETKDGDGAAMSMRFSLSGDESEGGYLLYLSQNECVIRPAAETATDQEHDHIMTEGEMVLAIEAFKLKSKK